MKYGGALPMQMIHELMDAGFITGADPGNVRPGSLDLRLSGDVFRVNASFLPGHDETVYEAIVRAGGIPMKGEKITLEKGVSYAVRIVEKIDKLPREVYGYFNPKSSSGRVDVHVRIMVDKTSRYDVIGRRGGDMWLLVVPKTFSVIVTPGLSLNQLRLFNDDTRLDETRLEMSFDSAKLLYDKSGAQIRYDDIRHSDRDGAVLLTLGLDFEQPGFEAQETGEPIDLILKGHYDPRKFFREVHVPGNSIVLQPDQFYILSTGEFVRVPEWLACEMRPMDERSGEHRSHYAGFIDPGWGIGHDGNGLGRPLTLEVRTFDSRVVICHGQPVAKIRYERMREKPAEHYDLMNPTYGNQSGPKLAKNFSEWK